MTSCEYCDGQDSGEPVYLIRIYELGRYSYSTYGHVECVQEQLRPEEEMEVLEYA